VFTIAPMRATCPVYLILLELINLRVSGEAYKLWRFSRIALFTEHYYSDHIKEDEMGGICSTFGTDECVQ